MSEVDSGADDMKGVAREYWCFLSYRHADNQVSGRQWASWLHQAIETYEVPADLVGTVNGRGMEIPERIFPVFRDEEELPADADLSGPIEAALRRSKTLVVLCSPRAVESAYVAEEILSFKRLGREDRVMAALLDGEPNAGRDGAKEGLECFPDPLLYAMGADGELDRSGVAEPIAADFRLEDGSEGWTGVAAYRQALVADGGLSKEEMDARVAVFGKRLELAKLKVIAGILGVPLGVLTKRDQAYQLEKAKRRAKVFRVIAGVMSLLAIVAIVSGVVAYLKQVEADEQRAQAEAAAEAEKVARGDAEGLVRFLTKELEEEVKGYLPLRLRERVTSEVEAYYERRKADGEIEVSEESWAFLFQQGKILRSEGKVDEARATFLKSIEVAEKLEGREGLERAWQDMVGESLGWLSELEYGDVGDAAMAREYATKAIAIYAELLEGEPGSADWREGVAMNETRLGDSYLYERKLVECDELYVKALKSRKDLYLKAREDDERAWMYAVATQRVANLRSQQAMNVEDERDMVAFFEEAKINQQISYGLGVELAEKHVGNQEYWREVGVAAGNLAEAERLLNDYESSRKYYAISAATMERLVHWDPDNSMWKLDYSNMLCQRYLLDLDEGKVAEAIATVEKARSLVMAVNEKESGSERYRFAVAERDFASKLFALEGHEEDAAIWIERALEDVRAWRQQVPDDDEVIVFEAWVVMTKAIIWDHLKRDSEGVERWLDKVLEVVREYEGGKFLPKASADIFRSEVKRVREPKGE